MTLKTDILLLVTLYINPQQPILANISLTVKSVFLLYLQIMCINVYTILENLLTLCRWILMFMWLTCQGCEPAEELVWFCVKPMGWMTAAFGNDNGLINYIFFSFYRVTITFGNHYSGLYYITQA